MGTVFIPMSNYIELLKIRLNSISTELPTESSPSFGPTYSADLVEGLEFLGLEFPVVSLRRQNDWSLFVKKSLENDKTRI